MLFCGIRAEFVSAEASGELIISGAIWFETVQKPKPRPIAIAISDALVQNRVALESAGGLNCGAALGCVVWGREAFINIDRG